MKRQRGIADLWLLAIVVVAILAALAGAITAWKSYTNGIDQKGYERGKQEVDAKWQARESEINADSAAKIEAANERVIKAERKGAQDVAGIRTDYATKLRGKDESLKIALDSLRDGSGRLSIPADCASGPPIDRNATGNAGGASPRDNGTGRTYLPDSLAADVLKLGAEADAVTIRLGKAQDLIASYYALCGPKP